MPNTLEDSIPSRERLAAALAKIARVELSCLPEDTAPEDHFEDPQDVAFARSGDPLAWFCAKVTVTFEGFAASDYLGCCSYNSEAEFKQPGGYYDDMVRCCCVDIVAQLFAAQNALVALAAAVDRHDD